MTGDELELNGTFGASGNVAPGVIATTALESARSGAQELDFDAAIAPLIQPGFRLALLMLDDPAEAEDAVQEAAMKAWRKLRTLRGEPRPWFLAIVANECRSTRRRRWFNVLRRDDIDTVTPWSDPADGAALRRAVRTLNADQRMIVALRFYLDLPLEEVAVAVGAPVGTVKSRLHRAMQSLRAVLDAEDA